jgi:hypothetical protein
MPSKVTSQPDTAMILVDEIPESGELGTGTRMLGGAALLMAGRPAWSRSAAETGRG